MSDPVTLTVTILVNAFLKGMGTAAGRDAYYALRNAIIFRYPEVRPKIEEFELDPGSRELQERLVAALRRLNADNDPNLQKLARQLRDIIEYGNSADPVDQLKRAVGFRQLQEILNTQLERLIRIRASYRVDGADLLSSNISRATDGKSSQFL